MIAGSDHEWKNALETKEMHVAVASATKPVENVFGITPSTLRSHWKQVEVKFIIGKCSLGLLLVANSQKGVCAILLGDNPETLACDLRDWFPKANSIGDDTDLKHYVAKSVDFVKTPRMRLDLPLDVYGTTFQKRVWQALLEIPTSQTVSYSDIACHIGAPRSVRAVAQACASNKIALAIPCHRVVRNDGTLGGYRWGVERKRMLIARERLM